jgi:excisionase family DNA binding protein
MQSLTDLAPLLSPQQAAKVIGSSVDSIRRRVWSGELPHYRLGRGPSAPIRIARADLELWLATNYRDANKVKAEKIRTAKPTKAA